MGIIENLKQKAKKKKTRLVFPEGEDKRVIKAANTLREEGITEPILIGNKSKIKKKAKEVDITPVEIEDPSEAGEEYISKYQEVREVSKELAEKIVQNELIFAGLMVKLGKADGMIGGCVRTSGDLISAGIEVIGLTEGILIPSSFFIMEIPDKDNLVYADCGVNPNPCPKELASIAISTCKSVKKLLNWEPRVALLSFSTKGSASHPDVEKVQKAVKIVSKKAPKLKIDGEFQGDAALDVSTAKRKIEGDIGEVAGKANTLIFPDLDAANIAYKLTQELADANAYGPILQGFKKPISDLSRGASVEDIVGAGVITANLVK